MNRKLQSFLLMLFAAVSVCAQIVPSKRIALADGLASNIVHVMAQDSAGYIWMGTASGLCRYDGYRFVQIEGLDVPNIGDIAIDNHRGLVWVRTSSFDYQCYVVSEGRFAAYEDSVDTSRQFRNHQLAADAIWLYDQDRGARCLTYADGRLKATDFNAQNKLLPTNRAEKVMIDARQRAFIITREGIVAATADGKTTQLLRGERIMAATLFSEKFYAITADGMMHVYDSQLRSVQALNIGRDNALLLKDPKADVADHLWGWLLFTSKGTYRLSLNDGTLSKPDTLQLPSPQSVTRLWGCYVAASTQGQVLLLNDDGSARLLTLTNQTSVKRIQTVRSNDGRLFFATQDDGLYVYEPQTGTLSHHTQYDSPALVYSNRLNCILHTRDDAVWVACDMAGIVRLAPRPDSKVNYVLPAPQTASSLTNMVRYITSTAPDTLLLSTRNNDVCLLSLTDMAVKPIMQTAACVYAYLKDRQGHTWMGTRGDGLYVDDMHYGYNDSTTHHLPTDIIYDLAEDDEGQIWIAGYSGGLLLATRRADGQLAFRQLLGTTGQLFYAKQIEKDQEGRLWIATSDGLYTTPSREWTDGREGRFMQFSRQQGTLPLNDVICLCVAHDGDVWIAGHTHGLYRCHYNGEQNTLETVNITMKQGLVNNNVRSIVEDHDGNIWVGTEEGMAKVNSLTNTATIFLPVDDLSAMVCAENAAACTADGRIFFATNKGVACMPIEQGRTLQQLPPPVITDLHVNGLSVYEDETLRPLIGALQRHDVIRLTHNQNSLEFCFSMLTYNSLQPQHFMFRLEGVETDWHSLTDQIDAQYNALRPGEYTFCVRAMAADGGWGDDCRLRIVISQPWWNTWWAWCGYIVMALLIAAVVFWQWWQNFRLHEQMSMERQMTEFRLDFFTHIAHEFRTPLALVKGAVDKLVDSQTQTVQKTSVQTARRGTRRLLKLVNQLMEFRKINTGNLRLQVEQGDLVAFVRDIYQDFWSAAKEKEQTMTFTPFATSCPMPFDRHMVETIVYNLLSNAVKYTPEKGRVAVRLEHEEETVRITVEDSGTGIKKEQEDRLFQPFMHGYVSQGGMGIGLYTVHRMAEAHHGSLIYKKGINGGSLFTLTLPATEGAYTPHEFGVAQTVEGSKQVEHSVDQELLAPALNPQTVAIIEDDPDMMQQLRQEVGAYFHVTPYMNGLTGYEGIAGKQNGEDGTVKVTPDLVLCDVMLPDMDGYEVVKRLRKEYPRLPIIMMTALDDDEHQLRAYKAGADDYMVKPCNFRLLMAKMMKWMERNSLQPDSTESRGSNEPETPATIITSQADKVFIERVQSIVAAHLSDEDFTVDTLAEAMSLGRSTFYNKMKDLLGMPPNSYIMKERMRKAAELVREGRLSMSEVAYRVGISNTSYFFKCFKKEFGVTPGKYGQR